MSPHPPRCGCKACRGKRRAAHIRRYYASLPRDERHHRSAKRRAEAAGVVSERYSRTDIMRRWNWKCCYCDAHATHLDHVMPISKGGEDIESNMVPACADCNLTKGAKTLAEWSESFRSLDQ